MILIDYSGTAITQIMGALQGDNTAVIEPDTFRHLYLYNLLEVKKKYGKRFGNIVFGVDNKQYWRKAMYPHYKCYRKKTKEDQGYDWNMIHHCMDTLKAELTEVFPYPVIDAPFAEADDVIYTMAEWSHLNSGKEDMFGEREPEQTLVIASDTDLVHCQKFPEVKQLSPYTKEQVLPVLERSVKGVKEKYKVPLDHFLIDHILTGDSGDSIPNILTEDDFFAKKLADPDTKVRQASVTAKIKEFYLNQLEEHGEIREYRSKEEEKNFKRNKRLVDLAEIPQRVKDKVLAVYHEQTGKDRSKLLDYFTQHRLKNLLDDIQEF
jgi:5'-3' exonuclease